MTGNVYTQAPRYAVNKIGAELFTIVQSPADVARNVEGPDQSTIA